jgi:hypothetical protein
MAVMMGEGAILLLQWTYFMEKGTHDTKFFYDRKIWNWCIPGTIRGVYLIMNTWVQNK